MENRRETAPLRGKPPPFLDLPRVVQYRKQPFGGELRGGAGKGTIENRDFGRSSESAAQRDAFIERRHEKQAASGTGQCLRDRGGAEAIAVRLDHRGALRRRGFLRQKPPIGNDRAEIDLENGSGAGSGVGTHRRVMNFARFASNRWPASECRLGQLLGADMIVELGNLCLEMQLDRADRTVPLL